MARTFRLFGRELVTFPVCYGLPTVFGVLLTVAIWLIAWSYYAKPVRFTDVKVEQVGFTGDYITLKITKYVVWSRLCPGIAEQEIRPMIAVDNPTKVSGSPIKLDSHVINTPKHKGPNAQPGDPAPFRFIVVPAGQLASGKWQYKVTANISCWPWEYLWPIKSDSFETYFTIQ